MSIRIIGRRASVVALIVAVPIGWWLYAFFGHRHVIAQARPAGFRNTADALQSTNAPLILAAADHFYWLNNGRLQPLCMPELKSCFPKRAIREMSFTLASDASGQKPRRCLSSISRVT